MEGLYSDEDIKVFSRELNTLYNQNQELHKLNKLLKFELRQAGEREH